MKKHYYCYALLALGLFNGHAVTTPALLVNTPATTIAPPDCELITAASATATSGDAALAIDGNSATRWESEPADPQSLTIDLGALSQINAVSIDWETANAKDYVLRGSVDGTTWVDIATQSNMAAGVRTDIISVNAQYQWLRMDGVARNTPYGYSIYEFNVCSTAIVPPPVCNAVAIASATASTGEATLAVDGLAGTRWESEVADPQSLTVDLGVIAMVHGVNIDWETANAKEYYLRGSADGTTWVDIAHQTDMPLGPRTDAITDIDAEYRWLKMDGVSRNTPYGYSIYEFEVCGEAGEVPEEFTAIPALIQAEDFTAMEGVQTEATGDEGGEAVSFIDAGDWMDYNIDVPADGTYTLQLRVASALDTGVIQLLVDDAPLTIENITVPNTGSWQTWQTISATFALTAGEHTLRLQTVAAGYNLNWLNFINSTAGTKDFGKTTVSLYPNPAHAMVTVKSAESGSVAIYNQYGAVVLNQKLTEGENSLDVSNLATGIFMVTSGGQSSKLIIK